MDDIDLFLGKVAKRECWVFTDNVALGMLSY